MKRTANYFLPLALLIFLFLANNCTNPATSHSNPPLLLQNVHTIDAKSGLKENQSILIQDNRIVEVGNSSSIKPPKGSKIIDGNGKFLIPGLWDAHVHLTYEKELSPTMLQLFLVNGITSVRETGGQLDLVLAEKEKAQKDPKNLPRVMIAGPLLDGVPTVYDGSSPGRPPLGVGAGSVEEAESLVEQFAKADVDLIKAYEMLTPEAFKAVVAKAKEEDLVVTGHVPLSMDVVEASDAGMRSMEHMRNLEMACSSDWEALLKTRQDMLFEGADEAGGALRSNIHSAQRTHAIGNQDAVRRAEVLQHLADNETWQCATLSILTGASLRPFAQQEWQDYFKYLPESMEKRWRSQLEQYLQTPVDSNRVTYTSWGLEMISHLKAAGVDIMAGTDTPIFFLTPGYSLHDELALLVKGGLTPLEAIEAATSKPAEYFNMENELGLIEEGMFADLVLLDANPLEDIRNTQQIHAVIRDGKLHDQAALEKLLEALDAREL